MTTVLFAANRGYGLWQSRRHIIQALLARGWRVAVATADDPFSARLEEMGAELHPVAFQRGSRAPWADLRTLLELVAVCRRVRPDLVHLFNARPLVLGGLAVRRAGLQEARVVGTVTGLGHAFASHGWVRRLAGLGYRLALPRLDHLVFQNSDDRALFQAAGWLDGVANSLLVGSGVDSAAFRPRAPTAEPATVVMLARLLWQKGVAEYLAMAPLVRSAHPGTRVLLAGELDPAHPDAVPAAAVTAADAVEFLGYCDDVPGLLAQADLFVLPSWYREGVPRVLLEAMAAGLPCVAADAPGAREVVRHGVTGLLVPPRDVPALTAAVGRLVADADLRRRFGAAARAEVEAHHDVHQICARHLALYDGLLPAAAAATA